MFLEQLQTAFGKGKLRFFGELEELRKPDRFAEYLMPLREAEWVVYAKAPFGGPRQVLDYLGRYTHRVALSNERLLDVKDGRVTFQWKDYRAKGREKSRVMTLDSDEFIRRFLIHVLPRGFQRIRFFGLLANRHRKVRLAECRCLLATPILELLPNPMPGLPASAAGNNAGIDSPLPVLRQRRDGQNTGDRSGVAVTRFLMRLRLSIATKELPNGSYGESLVLHYRFASVSDDSRPLCRRIRCRRRHFFRAATAKFSASCSCPSLPANLRTKQNP